jgi:hypothetical protein
MHSTPADVERRMQRAQLSQELQSMEREQRYQQGMTLTNSAPFTPPWQSLQQPFYSMNPGTNLQNYHMTQQTPMYTYY